MEGYLTDAWNYVTENWQGFVNVGCILLASIGIFWWTRRELRHWSGTMRPEEERRINRVAAYYLDTALTQAGVDGRLTADEEKFIRLRVGRILGIPSVMPRLLKERQGLKDELQEKHPKVAPVVAGKAGNPFDKFLAKS